MKKMILGVALISLMGFANASSLNEQQKLQVLNKISDLDHVSGYDVQDNIKLVNTGSDAQIKSYLVELTYNVEKQIDNPNALDLVDLKAGLEKKTIAQLSQ